MCISVPNLESMNNSVYHAMCRGKGENERGKGVAEAQDVGRRVHLSPMRPQVGKSGKC